MHTRVGLVPHPEAPTRPYLEAVCFRWSNGQVEGQVNRLKLVRRSTYGRAGFALLRRRVLAA